MTKQYKESERELKKVRQKGFMSEPKFTKGPWQWEQLDRHNLNLVGQDGVFVLSSSGHLPTNHNAGLIAAAPELYEALKETLTQFDLARAALAEMIHEARERNKVAGETVFNPAALELAIESLGHDEDGCSWPSGHCTCGVAWGTTSGNSGNVALRAKTTLAKAEGRS